MYPSWGHDIDKKTTPLHLSREHHVSFDVKNKRKKKEIYFHE